MNDDINFLILLFIIGHSLRIPFCELSLEHDEELRTVPLFFVECTGKNRYSIFRRRGIVLVNNEKTKCYEEVELRSSKMLVKIEVNGIAITRRIELQNGDQVCATVEDSFGHFWESK